VSCMLLDGQNSPVLPVRLFINGLHMLYDVSKILFCTIFCLIELKANDVTAAYVCASVTVCSRTQKSICFTEIVNCRE
jgi:hypothetical protein